MKTLLQSLKESSKYCLFDCLLILHVFEKYVSVHFHWNKNHNVQAQYQTLCAGTEDVLLFVVCSVLWINTFFSTCLWIISGLLSLLSSIHIFHIVLSFQCSLCKMAESCWPGQIQAGFYHEKIYGGCSFFKKYLGRNIPNIAGFHRRHSTIFIIEEADYLELIKIFFADVPINKWVCLHNCLKFTHSLNVSLRSIC